MRVTGEAPGWESKSVQESVDEVETNVYELVGKVIKGSQSYDIDFWVGFSVSYK